MHQLSFPRIHRYPGEAQGVTIPVRLRVNATEVAFDAQLDTGCSACVFERQQGEALGLDIESGDPMVFATAAGRISAFGHFVQIETLGVVTDAKVFFLANPGIAKNLLGRTGWLDRVRLALVDYDQTLYLSPYDAA